MTDNLQEIVDGMRIELARGWGGTFEIATPNARDPLVLDVTVDGVSAWLVRLTCGDRVLFNTGDTMCVKPEEFVSELYVFLRWAMRVIKTKPVGPS